MTIPDRIHELIELFDLNLDAYKSGHYNETQVRHEFIDPFFIELGWDVNNKQGYAEVYKDVIHEDSIKVGGIPKAPDYCFRVGGVRKFFLEAKKPSVDIKEDTHPAYQLRRYAWSAKLPLSILTDFEEFAVYDCRVRPVQTDKASKARVIYFTYKNYSQKWDEIASIFSQNAILKGSFDRYVETSKGKKGTAEVDRAFLREIEAWREKLAHNIALRNPALSRRDMNFAVQRNIDRIIFLRICEDRAIEDYGRLRNLMNGTQVYRRLADLFYRADDIYNSGLFHFRTEKDQTEPPDDLSPSLAIDDKPLKDIIKCLYYPDSPYEFSVLPADILGQVYEQFLGKVIRLTKAHRAVVEDKPEVKKAGGVYYTPTYIVDYIVKNTVGKLLDGATPQKASKLRILDPACGSGSFLIGAYQYLLDWHREWYENNDPEKWAKSHNPRLCKGSAGDWRLTTDERKRILLNSIYGVDIDPQAVEVTKLSLLLKVLEGENEQTLARQLKLFQRRALPNLSANIKCGNSLIGPDFYDGRQMDLFDEEERYLINVFDWDAEFSEIMKGGGFDAVIGNPPYGVPLITSIKNYLNKQYFYVSDYETAQYFIVKAEIIVKEKGYVSFIVPNTIFLNLYASKFRDFLLKSFSLFKYVNLSDINVFKNASVRTSIPVLNKSSFKPKEIEFYKLSNDFQYILVGTINQRELEIKDNLWNIVYSPLNNKIIIDKFIKNTVQLGSIVNVSQGLIPYDKYRGHDEVTIKNRIWHSDHKVDETYKRELRGGDVKRYCLKWNGKRWISYGPWLAAPRKKEFFTKPRLLFREITDPQIKLLNVVYTEKEFYNNPSIINCIIDNRNYSLLYLLGISNSKLISFYHFISSPKAKKGVFPKILVNDVRKLPIQAINFSDPADKARHDRMVKLVETMLTLHKQLAEAKTVQDKTVIQRQIDATDRQIDRLVYELYDLTEEEIKIVEEGVG